jgi:hypothetical protein
MMAQVIEPGSGWLDQRDSDNLFVVGRLKPGVTTAQAESALKTITDQLGREYPHENAGRGVRLLTPGLFIPDIRNSVISFSGVLMGVVALVVAARLREPRESFAGSRDGKTERTGDSGGHGRQSRAARPSTHYRSSDAFPGWRSRRSLIAMWLNALVSSMKLPTDLALVIDLHLDWRVLTFGFVVSLITGIFFGLLPALQSSRPDLVPALKDEKSMGGFRRSHLRNALVVAQVALSLVLLVCAGLVVRSLQVAQRTRPGFNPENAIALSFDLGLQGYSEEKGRAFQKQVLERTPSVPGVRSAALVGTSRFRSITARRRFTSRGSRLPEAQIYLSQFLI